MVFKEKVKLNINVIAYILLQ